MKTNSAKDGNDKEELTGKKRGIMKEGCCHSYIVFVKLRKIFTEHRRI